MKNMDGRSKPAAKSYLSQQHMLLAKNIVGKYAGFGV